LTILKLISGRAAARMLAGMAGCLMLFGTAYASTICPTASLSTYVNGTNSPCMIGSNTFTFGPTLSYEGLSLGAATPPTPNQITVLPGGGSGDPSLSFTGSFAVGPVVGSETNVFHFTVQSGGGPITSTQLSILDPSVQAGELGVGALAGTELVCLGGTFTSLPTGVLGNLANLGKYGCSGVSVQSAIVGQGDALSLAGLGATVGTQATLTFTTKPTFLDVLKIQTLNAGVTATVADGGLKDSFGISNSSVTPEPASFGLCGAAMALLAGLVRSKQGKARRG